MKLNISIALLLVSLFFIYPAMAEKKVSADKEVQYQQQIDKKTRELKEIGDQISTWEAKYQKVCPSYELLKKENQNKRNVHDNVKDFYTRASQNIDIVSPEQLSQLLNDYKKADKELKASEEELKKVKNEKLFIEDTLARLKKEKINKEIEILELKAEIYEDELREGVWVEGFGECILDENRTMKECQRLAIDYAKRDAIEKGGKSLIESVTQVRMFELTQDDIKKTAKVNIIEQDNRGDYGKVIKTTVGDIIKFTAKVRVKVQSVDIYNPYREKIKVLKGGVISSSAPDQVRAQEIEGRELEELKKKLEAVEELMKKDKERQEIEKTLPTEDTKRKEKKESERFVPVPGF